MVATFAQVHRDRITGTLTMFDRVIFRGHLSALYKEGGARAFLWAQGAPLTEFARYARQAPKTMVDHAERIAAETGRPSIYLASAVTRRHGQTKEDMARSIADQDGVTEGLVCVMRAVEPCRTFTVVRRNGRLEVSTKPSKCLQFYFYFIDAEFGFMHVRVQSWLPYEVQVYVNGREWLARQLDAAGVGYLRHDNALLRIDDLQKAAALCERFAHRAWPRVLDVFARRLNPHLDAVLSAGMPGYYWVADQVEVATDVMFRDRPSLAAVMPDLVHHAALRLSSEDVLGFLGRKLHPSLAAEVVTNTRRNDGWRVKHRVAQNWIKVYERVSVLRVETTINNPREFRVLRVFTDDHGRRERRWCQMAKGVANMWRYFQVGIGANLRYLDALAAAPLKGEGVRALDALCRSRTRDGHHQPRFNPLSPKDLALFRAVMAGSYTIAGFRNHDITARLYARAARDGDEARRRCARTSRLIAKLRGHSLIAKVPRERLYRVTPYGHRLLTAALAYHDDAFPDAYLAAA
jgi:hypothetical protein